jgi:elongation factor G
MKVFDTSDIRNVALIGHGDSGKTSVANALLFASGAVNRLGKVDDGTSITDFDDEEIERKISLQTAVAHADWTGTKINILDTPGYAAFLADTKVAMVAADTGLMVVEAVAGVQVITERVFGYTKQFGVPVIFLLSKLDRDNASFERTVGALQERFGRTAVPIQLPIGETEKFSGVVDLLKLKALRFAADASGKLTEEDVPAELADRAAESRSALVEMVAETDDSLMEAFFEAGDLTADQLRDGLRKGVVKRKLFPILCSAATQMIGIQPLLDALVRLVPAPDERGPVKGVDPANDAELTREVDSGKPLSAFVFKTIADPFAGKLSMVRVMTGTLKPDSHVINTRRDGHAERLGNLSVLQGKHPTAIGELRSGDIGVIAKLKETQTSDTLCDSEHPILYPPVTFAEPAISYAVEPKSKGDDEKISHALARLMEEDPVLRVRRDARSAELLVSGTGQVHVEVALAKMKRKFGVEAILHPPKVPYFETIKRKVAHVEGKHKKQSGGRGQFGVCVVDIEPLPRGSGFEFVDKIFGGAIPQNYRPAVEKGIVEAAERGWLAGAPMIDFRVTLTDGKYHNVDSSEMAFKIAGSLAYREAMKKAAPTILEPVMAVEIVVPEENMGDIMGDLSSRRGKPQGMVGQGGNQIIKAQVPMAEMLAYASTLKSLTSDRGSYTMEPDHYQEVPAQVQQKIIAEHAAQKEQEKAG